MKVINKIFWDTDKISMITNHLDADTHRHLMLQLFVGVDDYVEIIINGIQIKCDVIVINKNVSHSFSTNGKLYFSSIIDPTSVYGKELVDKMGKRDFLIYEQIHKYELSSQVKELLNSTNIEQYKHFYKYLLNCLELTMYKYTYDERISSVFQLLDINTCKCNDHSIKYLADNVFLSSSRLSHLFKEQTGIPLKSYILLHQMERAFDELFAGKNITKASMIAGFDSPSHFASTVKKMMGMPVSLSLKDSEFLKVY